jgi:hypothetical protein
MQSVDNITQATDWTDSRASNQRSYAGITCGHDHSRCRNRVDQRKSADNRPNRSVEPELAKSSQTLDLGTGDLL